MSPEKSDATLEQPAPASIREALRRELERTIPPNITILHYLGALILVFLGLQVLTGLLLVVYYRPADTAAFKSVAIITDEVRLGWLVRGLHSRGTDLLIVLCLLHMYRVYFSRAYQPPRQMSWTIGIVMLLFLFAMAFTGIILPWDQYGYWYTASAHETVTRIPLIGNVMVALLWGGWDLGNEVLLRFYAFHIGVLPWVALGFLLVHVFMIWRLGIKEPVRIAKRRLRALSFPDLLLNLLIGSVLIGGLLLTATTVFPPVLWQPADPISPPVSVQPRWYLLPIRGLLESLPGAWAALVVVLVLAALLLVPVIDRSPAPSRMQAFLHRAVGVGALVTWVLLGVLGYRG